VNTINFRRMEKLVSHPQILATYLHAVLGWMMENEVLRKTPVLDT
jgi:hypothetical protein